MTKLATDLLEIVLRECGAAAPAPWYPSAYVQATGVERASLDAALDQLRLGGLVRLTDWVQGQGQGYALTDAGADVLRSPRLLHLLRSGRTPAVAPPRHADPEAVERRAPKDRAGAVKAALTDPDRAVMSRALLFANVGVFVFGAMLAGRGGGSQWDFIVGTGTEAVREAWMDTGAVVPAQLPESKEWWRLLSCCFVHFGGLHLAMNMYMLFTIGPLVERMWGRYRFLWLYLAAGVCGSCAQAYFQPNVRLAGASGSLCGIFASMGVWVWLNKAYLPRSLAANWMNNLVINAVLIGFISMMPGVSWAGHLGGAVGGAAIGLGMVYHRFGAGALRGVGLAGALAVPVLAVLVAQQSLESRAANPDGNPTAQTPGKKKQPEQPLTAEEAKLRQAILPLLRQVDEGADHAYTKYVDRLLKDKNNGVLTDEATVKEAEQTFAGVRDQAKKTRERLDAFGKPGTERAQNHAVVVRGYLKQCEAFFTGMVGLAPRQADWNDEVVADIKKAWKLLRDLRSRWQDSPLWRAQALLPHGPAQPDLAAAALPWPARLSRRAP